MLTSFSFQEQQLKTMDPKKAEAASRLGMGGAHASKTNTVYSHSAITEMNTIEQEEPSGSRKASAAAARSSKSSNWGRNNDLSDDGDDDFEHIGGRSGGGGKSGGFGGFSERY
jgi:hypothetical protein